MTRLITRCAAVALMVLGVSPAVMASIPAEAPGMLQGYAPLLLPQGAGADPLLLQEARRGRGHDDGAMHARRGRGHDDGAMHARRGRGHDDGAMHARRGNDDPAGHVRHGRGADDAVGHA